MNTSYHFFEIKNFVRVRIPLAVALSIFCLAIPARFQETQAAVLDVKSVDQLKVPTFDPPKRSSVVDYLPDFLRDAFKEEQDRSKVPPILGSVPQSTEYAVLLDGSSGYIRVPQSANLDVHKRFTVEIWFKPTEIGRRMGIFEKYKVGRGGYSVSLTPNAVLELTIAHTTPEVSTNVLTGRTPIVAGQWNHFAMVVEGSTAQMFVNGKIDNQLEIPDSRHSQSADFTIGMTRFGTKKANFFSGLIDEVRIATIQTYRDDFRPKTKLLGGGIRGDVLGNWRFTDQHLDDGSGNNNHGEIVGNAFFVPETPVSDFSNDSFADEAVPTSTTLQFDPPQIFTGQELDDAYQGVSFLESNIGLPMFAYDNCYQLTDYTCPGQSGINHARAGLGSWNVQWDFSQPSTVSSFNLIGVDYPSGYGIAYISLKQDGNFSTFVLVSSGPNIPVTVYPDQYTCGGSACNRVTQVVVWNIIDFYGFGYDNVVYAPFTQPTPTPPDCRSEPGNNAPPPCGEPTPSPSPGVPNVPTNVIATNEKGQVKITGSSFATESNSARPESYKIYRSNSANGQNAVFLDSITNSYPNAYYDKQTALRIDTTRYYAMSAVNSAGESAKSVFVGGKPLSACDGPARTPPGPQNFNAFDWKGTYVYEHGFSAANVSLKDRLMAVHMGVPSIDFRFFDGTQLQALVDLDNPSYQTGWISILSAVNQAKSGETAASAQYCVSSPNGQEKYEILISYDFRPEVVDDPCEPSSSLPCARFFADVSFIYTSDDKFNISVAQRDINIRHLRVFQRFHYRENGNLNNVAALVQDCDKMGEAASINKCRPDDFPVSKKGLRRPKVESIIPLYNTAHPPGSWASYVPTNGTQELPRVLQSEGYPDNFHQTSEAAISLPGPFNNEDFALAGCPSCVHTHWRWTPGLIGYLSTFPPILTPFQLLLARYVQEDMLRDRGTFSSRHNVGIDYRKSEPHSLSPSYRYESDPLFNSGRQMASLGYLVSYRSSEFNNLFPPVNGERIYNEAEAQPNFMPIRGSDIVFWNSHQLLKSAPFLNSGSWQTGELFYASGGFFQPVRTMDKVLPVVPDLPSTTANPTSVTSQLYFKRKPSSRLASSSVVEEIEAIRLLPDQVAQFSLPPGYTPLQNIGFSLSIAGDFLYKNLLVMQQATGGKQITRFDVPNTGVPFNDIRILHSETDDFKPEVRQWIDRTILSGVNGPDSTNRIIRSETTNLGVFILATYDPLRTEPSSSPTDLRLLGSVSPTSIASGNNVTYSFTISNQGSNTASDVVMVQDLASSTDLVSAKPSAGFCHTGDGHAFRSGRPDHETDDSGAVYCRIGDLQVGETVSVTIVVGTTVFGDGVETTASQISSEIRVAPLQTDTQPANNTINLTFESIPSTNRLPQVTIVSPIADATFVSTVESPAVIPIQISASDPDGSVSEVKVYDFGELIGTATSGGNGTYALNFTPTRTGYHSLTAIAVDNESRDTTSTPVQILVNGRNTIAIVNPIQSIVQPGSEIVVETRSNVSGNRIQKVELFDRGISVGKLGNAANVGNVYSHRITLSNLSRGLHSYTAVLTDLGGATTTSAPISLKVTAPPSVTLSAPNQATSFAFGQDVDITVQVADGDGYVKDVSFFASGKLIGSKTDSIVKGSSTYRWISPPDGIYTISVVVTDDTDVKVSSNAVNISIGRPSPAIGEFVWVDDSVPLGATTGGDEGWNWTASNPASLYGNLTHQSLLKAGLHEHSFENAQYQLQVETGDKISAWIFIDPGFPPAEIMLQWKDDQGWEHRAYWGQNLIAVGTDGTSSRRRIGEIPTGYGWKQLIVPANLVGLEGKLVNGMKFTLHGGRASWDRVGKIVANSPKQPVEPDFVWIDDDPPTGSILEATHDTWTNGTWVTSNPTPNTGARAHKHWDSDPNPTQKYRQRSFKNPTTSMLVKPGDTLFAWVYINANSLYKPDTLVLQWYEEQSGWEHRAYWGVDIRPELIANFPGASMNSQGWRAMGNVPNPGSGWVKLEIPASHVGLEGKLVKGMAFGIYQKNAQGRAVWDSAGKSSGTQPTIPAPQSTTPMYRYRCGTGSNERLMYTTSPNHDFFDFRTCSPKVNIGYVYSYSVPGTTPFYLWWDEDEDKRYLSPCSTIVGECIPDDWELEGIAAWLPPPTMPDTTYLYYRLCTSLENPYYTTYPNPPETVFTVQGCNPNTGGYQGEVHTH